MSHQQYYFVYILTNPRHTVLYTGVTNDLKRRISEHKQHLVSGFTSRYNLSKLIYFETFENINFAITREKQLKGGNRNAKIKLIENQNPNWLDLYPTLI